MVSVVVSRRMAGRILCECVCGENVVEAGSSWGRIRQLEARHTRLSNHDEAGCSSREEGIRRNT